MGLSSGVVTKQEFIQSLLLEMSKVQEEDVFILYFSGHGGRSSGNHYLLFSDGRIYTREIINYIDNNLIKTKIIFIDACKTGGGQLSENTLMESDFISEAMGKGTIVLASCREKEKSSYLLN